jgi:hypothetical protein
MSVIQQVGSQAGLLSAAEIMQFLEQAPAGYSVTEW